jgi:hypothetical protein
MDFVTGFEAEAWFRHTCRRLRMLDTNPPTLQMIEPVLRQHLPKKTKRAIAHMNDEYDPELWLDYILKIDALLSLQNLSDSFLRIGVDITTFPSEVSEKYSEICSKPFREARQKLKIDKHWIVIVSSSSLPSNAMLIDKFYEVVDHPEECSIIDLSP